MALAAVQHQAKPGLGSEAGAGARKPPAKATGPLTALDARRLAMQAIGNQRMLRLRDARPEDPRSPALEAEAESVADVIVGNASGLADASAVAGVSIRPARWQGLQRECACGGTCSSCRQEDGGNALWRKPTAGVAPHQPLSPPPPIVQSVLRTPGQPLDSSIRTFMEGRFGRSFARVSVHTGAAAEASARAVDAAAYTVGRDIVFGPGQYQPGSPVGRRVIAHELVHVVQQSGAASSTSGLGQEHEADRIADAVESRDVGLPVSEMAAVGLARLSFGDLEKKAWGLVPDRVKPYLRPAAEEAKKGLDAIVSPETQVPPRAEALIEHPRETVTEAAKSAVGLDPTKPVTASAVVKVVSQKAREKVRDTALETVGEAKGVVLEATNIVDTLAWLPHAAHQATTAALGTGRTADTIIAAQDFLTGYTSLAAAANAGGLVDPQTGGPAVSGAFSAWADKQADKLQDALSTGALPPENALLFTSYEQGELKGAIGTQVGLAFVGVEEVQLALKAVGLIGSVKGIVETIERDRVGWHKNPAFWAGLLGAALSLLGLRATRSANKLINIVIASGGVLNAVPAIWQLYNDWRDTANPKHDEIVKRDFGQVIKVLANAVADAIRHGGAGKPAGEPAGTPGAPAPAGPEAPGTPGRPTEPATARPTEPVAAAPAEPVTARPAEPATARPTEAATATPADRAQAPGTARETAEIEPRAGAPGRDEPVLSKVPAEGGHEVEVRPDGVHVCSPGPCPLLHIEYAKELSEDPHLAARVQEVNELRKTDPPTAAKRAAELQKTLELIRRRGYSVAAEEAAGDRPSLDIGKRRLEQIVSGERDFTLESQLGFDVDEPLPVGDPTIKPQRAVARALDPQNRQLLDPMTNRQTKGLGIDPRDIARARNPLPPVSLRDQPNALFTRRFGEVTELKQVFGQAVARVGNPRSRRPTGLKNEINRNMRDIINRNLRLVQENRRAVQEGRQPSIPTGADAAGYIVAETLTNAGFEFVPGRGAVAVEQE
jgi:hypothetical protein